VVLLLRAVLYWQLGAPAGWNPKTNLYFVVLAFRGDSFESMLAYSVFSFLRLLLIVWFWMLSISAMSQEAAEPDPILRLIRLQLGRLSRWPTVAQWLLPGIVGALAWVAFHPVLASVGVVGNREGWGAVLAQSGLVVVSLYLTLKYLLPIFLFLHFISSYVYLGNNPFWAFITSVSRRVLKPLARLPLQFGRLDLAPLAAILAILITLEVVPGIVLQKVQEKHRTVWPH
jgi:uncharacterized protein YggT (Ycf19 family)